jgi:hypothetical protein
MVPIIHSCVCMCGCVQTTSSHSNYNDYPLNFHSRSSLKRERQRESKRLIKYLHRHEQKNDKHKSILQLICEREMRDERDRKNDTCSFGSLVLYR